MGCFKVILKPLGSLSTTLITRWLITIMITAQVTDSKYFVLATEPDAINLLSSESEASDEQKEVLRSRDV